MPVSSLAPAARPLSQNVLSRYLRALLLTSNSAAKYTSALGIFKPFASLSLFFFFGKITVHVFFLATVRSLRKNKIQVVSEFENL